MEGGAEHQFQNHNPALVALPLPVRPMPQMQAQSSLAAQMPHANLTLGNAEANSMHVSQMSMGAGAPIDNENGEPDGGETGAGNHMQQVPRSNTLTLSYQGELYLFEGVPPEKVQAVLLLLGNRDGNMANPAAQNAAAVLAAQGVPSTIPLLGLGQAGLQGSKLDGTGVVQGRATLTQRQASLNRFREKRKDRCYDKKIRYTVRKEVANRMHRNKGQFASAGDNGLNGSMDPSDPRRELACVHCGTTEDKTPMMRRGPAGPRTLCNACGLMWSNKGVMRDMGNKSMQHREVNLQEATAIDGQ
mmetsp:Transcript_3413/g.12309  ORF Transcript_3413/g.12309 Transcript_3413/m.12309 type:complete len:302 (-) Transcript_3413:151-1056(-)